METELAIECRHCQADYEKRSKLLFALGVVAGITLTIITIGIRGV
jgi:hypothetical protein